MHSDEGESDRILPNNVTYTVSLPHFSYLEVGKVMACMY